MQLEQFQWRKFAWILCKLTIVPSNSQESKGMDEENDWPCNLYGPSALQVVILNIQATTAFFLSTFTFIQLFDDDRCYNQLPDFKSPLVLSPPDVTLGNEVSTSCLVQVQTVCSS